MTGQARRSLTVAAAIWAVATVAVEYLALSVDLHPFAASREARISDHAFDLLLYYAIPVFTFVIVVVGYAIVRHRAAPDDDGDGPPIRNNAAFTGVWMVVTSALAVLVIIHPGFTGLDELRAEPDADLVVDVEAEQWKWTYTYPDSGVSTQDTLVLPVDTRIRFRITSTDVIHSFWVPAFRIKQDAVPGIVTETMVTPEVVGTFADQDVLRVQCAELCGMGHARMWTTVRVVSGPDFDRWLEGAGG